MSKRYSIFLIVLFCLFLFGFGALHLALPDRTFSEQENRNLAQFKAPTVETLQSGKFMEDFQDYVTDQFPLRDSFVALKAITERGLGKRENNGVYLGRDGQTLFAQFTPPSADDLSTRVGYVNKLADNLSIPVYFSLIPDKSRVWADRLPARAPRVDDGSTSTAAEALCSERVHWIDLSDALHGDDVFYRTDHHWTTMGAYQGYVTLSLGMGGSGAVFDYPYILQSDSFYGTTWSSSGASWVEPDELYSVIPEGGEYGRITVTSYRNGTPEAGSLYDESFLEKKDKYSFFLGGNQPLCVITNPDAGGGKLLVVRDSYSDSLAPFLALEFQEVHLFDLRYNRTSLKQYVEENGISQVLVLYSLSNFTTDGNLFLLGR